MATTPHRWHVKVNGSKQPDLYAAPQQLSLWEDDPCGCEVQSCGYVIPKDTCPFHSSPSVVKIAKAHLSTNCLGRHHDG